MKKFEYLCEEELKDMQRMKNFKSRSEFWNFLGQQGWELIPNPTNNSFVFKREISEPNVQRTVHRDVEYSRA